MIKKESIKNDQWIVTRYSDRRKGYVLGVIKNVQDGAIIGHTGKVFDLEFPGESTESPHRLILDTPSCLQNFFTIESATGHRILENTLSWTRIKVAGLESELESAQKKLNFLQSALKI